MVKATEKLVAELLLDILVSEMLFFRIKIWTSCTSFLRILMMHFTLLHLEGIYLEQGDASIIDCNISRNSLTGISAISPDNAVMTLKESVR